MSSISITLGGGAEFGMTSPASSCMYVCDAGLDDCGTENLTWVEECFGGGYWCERCMKQEEAEKEVGSQKRIGVLEVPTAFPCQDKMASTEKKTFHDLWTSVNPTETHIRYTAKEGAEWADLNAWLEAEYPEEQWHWRKFENIVIVCRGAGGDDDEEEDEEE